MLKTKPWLNAERSISEIFGERLNAVMQKNGVSVRQIERDGVCSYTMIDRYLRQIHIPNIYIFRRICRYFDVSADYMLGLSDEPYMRPTWVWNDGECRCSKCHNRGETTYQYCPHCGERMDLADA